MAETGTFPHVITPDSVRKSHKTNGAFAKGRLIDHAQKLEESLMEAAKEMREQVSLPAPASETPAAAAARRVEKRAAAGVLSRIVIAWDTALDRVRVVQGKPLPGQKRPIPDELKPRKAPKVNAAPDDL